MNEFKKKEIHNDGQCPVPREDRGLSGCDGQPYGAEQPDDAEQANDAGQPGNTEQSGCDGQPYDAELSDDADFEPVDYTEEEYGRVANLAGAIMTFFEDKWTVLLMIAGFVAGVGINLLPWEWGIVDMLMWTAMVLFGLALVRGGYAIWRYVRNLPQSDIPALSDELLRRIFDIVCGVWCATMVIRLIVSYC